MTSYSNKFICINFIFYSQDYFLLTRVCVCWLNPFHALSLQQKKIACCLCILYIAKTFYFFFLFTQLIRSWLSFIFHRLKKCQKLYFHGFFLHRNDGVKLEVNFFKCPVKLFPLYHIKSIFRCCCYNNPHWP